MWHLYMLYLVILKTIFIIPMASKKDFLFFHITFRLILLFTFGYCFSSFWSPMAIASTHFLLVAWVTKTVTKVFYYRRLLNVTKFTRKHLHRDLLSRVTESKISTMCFSVNFVKYYKTTIMQNTYCFWSKSTILGQTPFPKVQIKIKASLTKKFSLREK